jgi:coenzyme F420 hydrogenase subunit beta
MPPAAIDACPGKGLNYPDLCGSVFGRLPENWLIGCYRSLYVGHSRAPDVRRHSASGGIITHALLYLLEGGAIDGAVVVRQGRPEPWQAQPIIARSAEEIRASSQSVYTPVPVNTLLDQMESFQGRLAYVGLPDQVASLRRLQQLGHPGARKVEYVLGPYVGTIMYFDAIVSYLRACGIHRLEEVAELKYREGEWPGYLQIKTSSGKTLRLKKFYFNYLIPFYITQSSLFSVDFTNELADISVGDAWHPRYERAGQGFSVVVARSEKAESVLLSMRRQGLIELEGIPLDEALSMHGHMLDFKKRGAFVRMQWRRAAGKRVPDYGYRPRTISLSRKIVEAVVSLVFVICRTRGARRLLKWAPVGIVGPLFDLARKAWKGISKPTKRRGLGALTFDTWPSSTADGQLHPARQRAPMPHSLWARAATELRNRRRHRWSFADVAAHWDGVESYDDFNRGIYSYFRRFVDGLRMSGPLDGARLLDFCARTGNGTLYFSQHGKVRSAVCADVSSRMGEVCRRRLREAGVPDSRWVHVSDYSFPFADGEFDAVLCFETVEHFSEPERLLMELGRVTRSGGILMMTTPNVLLEPVHALAAILGLHHSEGPHRFLRYRRLLRMTEEAGFRVERSETTVLLPWGPAPLLRLGEWLESRTKRSLMPLVGLRRVMVCRKILASEVHAPGRAGRQTTHDRPSLRAGVAGLAAALVWATVVHGAYSYLHLARIWPKVRELLVPIISRLGCTC